MAFSKLSEKAKSQQVETQAASQVEIDKLKKRLTSIETDLESKDKELLTQETQMMELTEQVEAHQKREEGLNTKIAEMEDVATKMEENKT